MKYSFAVISLLGKPGSGKGTQVEMLAEKTGFRVIHTGNLLRRRALQKDAVGRIIRETLKKGFLIPTPIVFSLWMPILEKVKNAGSSRGVIFDGNPYKHYEASMLDEVLRMFGWEKRFRSYYIQLSNKEAQRRLLKRYRADDTAQTVAERLKIFEKEIKPVLRYYKAQKKLVEVDGNQPPAEVHKELFGKLEKFLNKR